MLGVCYPGGHHGLAHLRAVDLHHQRRARGAFGLVATPACAHPSMQVTTRLSDSRASSVTPTRITTDHGEWSVAIRADGVTLGEVRSKVITWALDTKS